LLDTTAFALSCAVPTLFTGRTPAAYAVPPNATSNATEAITVPGVGRRSLRRPPVLAATCASFRFRQIPQAKEDALTPR
jgi:hypothetical protein